MHQRVAPGTAPAAQTSTGPRLPDAAWITAALRSSGVAVRPARVTAVAPAPCGEGKVGHCARLLLDWTGVPDGHRPPGSVVAKVAAVGEHARNAGHASGAYLREVAFYRDLAARSGLRVPVCFRAETNQAAGDFTLLLSDVPHLATDQVSGTGTDQIALALREIANLHALFWNRPPRAASSWLPSRAAAGGRSLAAAYRLLLPGFLGRFGDRISANARTAFSRLDFALRGWLLADVGGMTVTHGDYRLDNLLFDPASPGERLTVVDWQTVIAGPGTSDAAYLIGSSMRVALRQTHERDLLALYHEALQSAGVRLSWPDCWRSYRINTLSGLHMTVVGAMLTEPGPRTDEMFQVMAERHAAHANDLEAFAAIGE